MKAQVVYEALRQMFGYKKFHLDGYLIKNNRVTLEHECGRGRTRLYYRHWVLFQTIE